MRASEARTTPIIKERPRDGLSQVLISPARRRVVLGAASGIASRRRKRWRRMGASVMCADRDMRRREATADRKPRAGGSALSAGCRRC